MLALLAVLAAAAPSSATVTVRDYEFVRAGAARPAVRVRAGAVVTWRWRARESHQVTGSGPQRFRSRTKADGRYAVRLRRRGTYRVVCSIHAPGMKHTIVVR